MARIKTTKEFYEWVKDDAAIDDVLRRVAEGTKFSQVCKDIKRPYTLLYPYLHSTPELKARYEAALAARADDLMHETLEIADALEGSDSAPEVAAGKVRIDTRQKIASGWNRERYGERLQLDKEVTVTADAGLIGFASTLLEKMSQGRGRTLENAADALPESTQKLK